MTLLRLLLLSLIVALASAASAQGEVQIARVQYGGGGDWYSGDPLPTLIAYTRQHSLLDLAPEPITVELTSDRLFTVPILYLNGHGNVVFTDAEAGRLRRYLEGGGFLIVNDDYGLDQAVRRELAKVFPEQPLQPLPASHPVYRAHYAFPDGLPKIHEHDGEPAVGYGLFHEGRLVVFYAHESDLADGWEPAGIHPDPPEAREAALRMGVNLLVYAMTQGIVP
ncbi:hypothetical protein B1759_09445 [Rubrivirga sp. SAORIC476]|uniref:DUF4159 domain-containing protein n=1 Tax=Rubrivirga sp. SAORIC476 TaxID=1961794 RepID=UPI000BA9634C|nr:DUF4159 domain-containing protein [Rubrivirga sp. SAORIC476]PAP81527.1 hypothetical protein B1759_09445 [Rubrivirga sp. SAORIC476]